jgi:hypothetical protein
LLAADVDPIPASKGDGTDRVLRPIIGEQSSQLIEMIRKFPTTAFLAGRLKEVGWESDYGQCLLTQFREDLIQECGDELSKVLEHFRLISFESSSR